MHDRRWTAWVAALGLLITSAAAAPGVHASPVASLFLETVSNRADLVSGGDVLLRVIDETGLRRAPISFSRNGRRIGVSLHRDPSHRSFLANIGGLRVGKNTITATTNGQTVALRITNHPIGGPVFAGPQKQPWTCTTQDHELGPPKDGQCNAPTTVSYMYRSTAGAGFQPYDPANPPDDVATTTTDQGVTVPFILRVEQGTLDRSIYQIAVLADPNKPWTPWMPQRGWNHKLLVPFGGGCAAHHAQTAPAGILDESAALGRGFAVAASGLNTLSQNCNEVVSAEALMMLKERIVETLGTIRYTIGKGGSGGSVQQQNIAATYPGLLNGIQPGASYPDVWTTANEIFECALLFRYFNEVSPHLWPVAPQRGFVAGHSHVDTACFAWVGLFAPAFEPTGSGAFGLGVSDNGCAVPAEDRYDPETNPKGVRCAISDYDVAIFGRRAKDGFAKRPMDNVGVQYGLNALNSGLILPEQFVDLNEKIGGLDIDMRPQPQRTRADPGALDIAYRSGRVSDAGLLSTVPMIDLRIPENEEIHQHYYSYTMRARLDTANRTHANQIIWTGGGSDDDSLVLMDKWLSRIEQDPEVGPLARKVIRNKPAEAVDACGVGSARITDTNLCRAAFPYYANPRIAAGGPFANDILKCQLRPLHHSDYDVSFSDDEWARLQKVFRTGVCNWNEPGVGQQPAVPWLTYEGGPGGKPLGAPPRSRLVSGG